MPESSAQTVLVTGAAGFIGGHVLDALIASGVGCVLAVDLRVPSEPRSDCQWRSCDLCEVRCVAELLAESAPTGILHLAGAVGGAPADVHFRANVQAGANLLAALSAVDHPPRMLLVGSAAEYGIVKGGHETVTEDRPLRAKNAYGLSKILQEQWGLLYADMGQPVVFARPFNIIGPGQPNCLVPSAFLEQVARVQAGRQEAVLVGNLTARRDFLDVRDVADALVALLLASEHVNGQAYNISSGVSVGIDELLQACVGLADRPIDVRQDPARMRPVDVPSIVGDCSKLRSAIDWQPRIAWRESLADMWCQV